MEVNSIVPYGRHRYITLLPLGFCNQRSVNEEKFQITNHYNGCLTSSFFVYNSEIAVLIPRKLHLQYKLLSTYVRTK